MMKKKRVKIIELSAGCLTRARGDEAYRRLRGFLDGEAVEVELDAADSPSTSFLDELICKLEDSGLLDRVVFSTRTPRVERRLSQIAAIRKVNVYLRSESGSAVPLAPKNVRIYRAKYERSRRRALG